MIIKHMWGKTVLSSQFSVKADVGLQSLSLDEGRGWVRVRKQSSERS